jgi:hypothetical protein
VGRHYLPFESADECIQACHRLLNDSHLSQQMRQANHRYYVEEIEPAAHVAAVLRTVADRRARAS